MAQYRRDQDRKVETKPAEGEAAGAAAQPATTQPAKPKPTSSEGVLQYQAPPVTVTSNLSAPITIPSSEGGLDLTLTQYNACT